MGKIEIEPLGLVGAKLLRAFAAQDERGDFTKIFDNQVLGSLGFEAKEVFLSTNRLGVIRGLHYQNPNPQAKVVFCTRGQVWDVIADLRKSSTTFGKWHAQVLSEKNRLGFYIPQGFAHGFASMEEGSQVVYLADAPQQPSCETGVRHDDLELGISWPDLGKKIFSARDRQLPALKDARLF